MKTQALNEEKERAWFDISCEGEGVLIITPDEKKYFLPKSSVIASLGILDTSSVAYKALCVIERIALHEDHEENIWFIYEAAHVALGRCKADHQDWIEKVEALYNKLQQTGHL